MLEFNQTVENFFEGPRQAVEPGSFFVSGYLSFMRWFLLEPSSGIGPKDDEIEEEIQSLERLAFTIPLRKDNDYAFDGVVVAIRLVCSWVRKEYGNNPFTDTMIGVLPSTASNLASSVYTYEALMGTKGTVHVIFEEIKGIISVKTIEDAVGGMNKGSVKQSGETARRTIQLLDGVEKYIEWVSQGLHFNAGAMLSALITEYELKADAPYTYASSAFFKGLT